MIWVISPLKKRASGLLVGTQCLMDWELWTKWCEILDLDPDVGILLL